MAELTYRSLLDFAKRLSSATSLDALIALARDEARTLAGYEHSWIMVGEREDPEEVRLLGYAGGQRDLVWDLAPVLKIKGDRFLEAVIASEGPLVIDDARLDPRTDKRMVEALQNRTLINIPLRLLDKPFGIFGVGTFGDEGCRPPSAAQLDYLVGMAGQLALAAGRIRFVQSMANAASEKLELERRLMHAQKLESLGLLAGGIAHDFNNLLTVILSSAVLAAQSTAEPHTAGDLRAVIEAAERAGALTKQLLAMGRQQDLQLRKLELNASLREMLTLVRRVFPATIAIDLIPGVQLPLVYADASQLDQVFMNLCINARDAMPQGGRLTIETEQVVINGNYARTHPWAKPGRYVLVTVTDTGSGMSREVLDRIFDPFFTTKAAQGGSGLGLAVSFGIVSQHGGMLHCYSEPGLGTSFKVYLPVAEQLASAVGTKLAGAAPRAHEGERILLVEDDPAVRMVAARILERAGYAVTAVDNGHDACLALQRAPFLLAIVDVVMPDMQCRDLVDRIGTLRPGTRILLASGYSAAANVADLLERTGLNLLRKPFDPDQLLFGVRQAIDEGRAP